jgi:hypothetical protein
MLPNKFANASNINSMMDPILEKMSKMPGIATQSLIKLAPAVRPLISTSGAPKLNFTGPVELNERMNWFDRRHDPNGNMALPRGLYDMDSRLLGEAELKHPKLAEYLERSQPDFLDAHLRLHVTGGGKVLEGGNETSVMPAWRKTFVHILGTGQGTGRVDAMRELAPNMGAYVNEVRTISRLKTRVERSMILTVLGMDRSTQLENRFLGGSLPKALRD